MACESPALVTTDTASLDVAALIADVVETHHAYLRQQLQRVDAVAADIIGYSGADEPVLTEIRQLVGGLRACIEAQLDREEQQLFPILQRLETQTHVTKCHAGMIRSRIMMAERDLARIRGVITRLHNLAQEHLSPAGACEACHDLLGITAAMLTDLREHTRKESEVLFPWAVAREAALVR